MGKHVKGEHVRGKHSAIGVVIRLRCGGDAVVERMWTERILAGENVRLRAAARKGFDCNRGG